MDFIVKLWRGDYPLVKSFWIFDYLFGVLGFLIILGLQGVNTYIYFAAAVIYIVYVIIAWVGTWRSADKYNGRKRWSVLAKVAVVLDVLSNIILAFTY